MHKKSGFTLIELLVVIAIIGILASIAFSVGSSMIVKAHIRNTQASVNALLSACEQYKNIYYQYPNLDQPPTGYTGNMSSLTSGSGNYPDDDFQEYNRRLRYMMEERRYIVQEVKHGPFISNVLPKVREPANSTDENDYMYSDSWGQVLLVCPARDHTEDNPPGPTKTNRPPDIVSVGPNGVLNSGRLEAKSQFDTTEEDADDIVSWITGVQHVEGKD